MKPKSSRTTLGILSLLFVITTVSLHAVAPIIEHAIYDLSFVFQKKPTADIPVVIVGVDAQSIALEGDLPWPRERMAQLLTNISADKPRAMALDFLFPMRPEDQGNTSLAAALAGISNLTMGFQIEGVNDGATMAIIPSNTLRHRFPIIRHPELAEESFGYVASTLIEGDSLFASCADRAGFLNASTTVAGQKLYRQLHVIRAGNDYYPSFGAAAAANWLNLPTENFELDGAGSIRLGDRRIDLDRGTGAALINFRGGKGAIRTVSAAQVLAGNFPAATFTDKLVFVGVTDPAASKTDFFTVPTSTQFPGVEMWATVALDIITDSSPVTGGFGEFAAWLLMFLIFPGIPLLVPARKNPIAIAAISLLSAASLATAIIALREFHYVWNAGLHVYAFIFALGFTASRKVPAIMVDTTDLVLVPPVDRPRNVLPPPGPEDFLSELPQTDTARHVVGRLLPALSVDGSLPALNDPRILDQFRNMADGQAIKLLGSGGMADVYLIWKPRLEVYRAIKVIKPGQSQQWHERFETEIRIVANITHPNIVQCYGVGTWMDCPWLEMEYISGSTLESALRICGTFQALEVLAIGALICRALAAAHNQPMTIRGQSYRGIIHRDLKPANILLSLDGHIKLADFGIARPGADSLHLDTADGKVVGTLPYLAPEQLENGETGPAVDIYALGATLYECATGRRAFPQITIPTLVKAKTVGDFERIKSSAHIPDVLSSIINRAMEQKPERRYHSAEAMGRALETALAELLSDAPPHFIFERLLHRTFES